MKSPPPIPAPVADALSAVPLPARSILAQARELIFDVADCNATVGTITETLKWGQPSYAAKRGTPLRLGLSKSGEPALLAHCQTTVVSDARALFGAELRCEGNRAILLPADDPVLRRIILAALTYRLTASSDQSA